MIHEISLLTSRLLLRQPSREDASALSLLWRDEQMQHYLGGMLAQEAAEARASELLNSWEVRKCTQCSLWVVCERSSDTIVGLCTLSPLEAEIEISYKLAPAFWGKGYALEAATATLEDGFSRLGLESIVAMTQTANTRSRRLLEKLGMSCEKSLRAWDAEQYFYRLNREDWLDHKRGRDARATSTTGA
jgi:ribosomal-protein-alanine N-acetyltransferase